MILNILLLQYMVTVKSGHIQSRRTSLEVNVFCENYTVCESKRDGIISGQARIVSVRTVYIPGLYFFKDRILYFSGPYTLQPLIGERYDKGESVSPSIITKSETYRHEAMCIIKIPDQ